MSHPYSEYCIPPGVDPLAYVDGAIAMRAGQAADYLDRIGASGEGETLADSIHLLLRLQRQILDDRRRPSMLAGIPRDELKGVVMDLKAIADSIAFP